MEDSGLTFHNKTAFYRNKIQADGRWCLSPNSFFLPLNVSHAGLGSIQFGKEKQEI